MVSGSVKKKEVDRTFEKIEKKKKKKKPYTDIYFQIAHQLSKRLDDRIYLNKYYPWCYKIIYQQLPFRVGIIGKKLSKYINYFMDRLLLNIYVLSKGEMQ